VDNRLEKIHFADLVKDESQLQVFLFPADFEWDGVRSHMNGLAVKSSFKMAASKVASFETNFIRLAGTSCLLAIGEDKK